MDKLKKLKSDFKEIRVLLGVICVALWLLWEMWIYFSSSTLSKPQIIFNVFYSEVENMPNTVYYLILFIYILLTLHLIINFFFLLFIIIKRKDVRIITDLKKANILITIKSVLLLLNIIISFCLFCFFFSGVIEMAKSIFDVLFVAYLFITIPTTFVFSLISIATGISIYCAILKSDISIFKKIMLVSLNMQPMFDIITILIMKERKTTNN